MARETLTAEKIIEAAVSLLDTDGLDGFNMRTLGAPATSRYPTPQTLRK